MTPQAATAMQPLKTSVPVTQIQTENVLDRFQQVYDSIARRAFDIFDANGRWFGNELEDWLLAESEILHPVHLELAESDDNLTVRAEVPGFSTKEIEINVEPRRLTIAGKHEAKEEGKKGKTVYSEATTYEGPTRSSREPARTFLLGSCFHQSDPLSMREIRRCTRRPSDPNGPAPEVGISSSAFEDSW